MASGERIFVQAIRRYCATHGIALDVRAGGWLLAMRSRAKRHFAFGYDVGLNSAIAHPQMMITSGVRQVAAPEDGRRSPVVTAIKYPCRPIEFAPQ